MSVIFGPYPYKDIAVQSLPFVYFVLTFVNSIKNYKGKKETYCDIFFSAETIKKDAKKNRISFYDHITHLMIHCFLHVNGYDHKKETDFIKMKNLEEKIKK